MSARITTNRLLVLGFSLNLLGGCLGPPPATRDATPALGDNSHAPPPSDEVRYTIAPEWNDAEPRCIAVLPFKADVDDPADDATLARVRRAVVAQLAPLGFRDIEAARIDWLLARTPDIAPADLARELGCDHFLHGRVTATHKDFLAVYSRISTGARLQLRRAQDQQLLWRAAHTASLQDGGLPLTPVGLAGGIVSASSNLSREQLDRVTNDLARRLLATLPSVAPDLRAPDTQLVEAPVVNADGPADATGLDAWLAGLSEAERVDRLYRWARRENLDPADRENAWQRLNSLSAAPEHLREWARFLYRNGDYAAAEGRLMEVTAIAPDDPLGWELLGRVDLALERPSAANLALLRAVGLTPMDAPSRAHTLAALAYSYNQLGQTDKAGAAYRLAVQLKPDFGYAWYNLAIMDFNAGHLDPAARKFHLAANAYLGDGREDLARGVLKDLTQTDTPYARQAARQLRRALAPTTRQRPGNTG